KVYDGHGRRVEAIGDLTFSVADGELACLVGPSGCGKTTLLKIVAGLLAPTAGTVTVGGRPVTGPPADLAGVFQEKGPGPFPRAPGRGQRRAADPPPAPGRARPPGRRGADRGRAGRRRSGVPVAVVRRDAAAGRDRAGRGVPASRPVDGRAVRGGRRP